jgi:hypothetical protein
MKRRAMVIITRRMRLTLEEEREVMRKTVEMIEKRTERPVGWRSGIAKSQQH